ncbi:MAG: ABC transporter permease [Acidimicrobiaceae bacterium]|nr:ABC transporter permease [Acidimicrobiaceae bacterium]
MTAPAVDRAAPRSGRWHIPITVEQRAASRFLQQLGVNLVALVLAFGLGAILLLMAGDNPFDVYREMFDRAFGSSRAFRETLRSTTPLILTGLAVTVCFRMGLWSIGAEGQLIAGSVAGAAAALVLGPSLPAPLVVAAVVIAAALGGAAWATLASVPRALFGTDEVVTTLMLNFVALGIMNYLIYGSVSYWRDRTNLGFPAGKVIPESAQLDPYFGVFDAGLIISLALALIVALALRRTVWGYQLRVAGDSRAAASYAGISATRQIISVFAVSGALAGIAGGTFVMSITFALEPRAIAVNLGFVGIVVAAVALLKPLLVVPIAFLMGALLSIAPSLSIFGVSPAVVIVIQGIILLCVAGAQFFIRYRVRITRVEVCSR